MFNTLAKNVTTAKFPNIAHVDRFKGREYGFYFCIVQ